MFMKLKLGSILLLIVVLAQCGERSYNPQYEGENLCKLFAIMSRNDQKNREVFELQENKNTLAWETQLKMDSVNTELMLEIVRYRGFPSPDNCSCDTFPDMVFMHSPSSYFTEIQTVINEEHNKNRLDDMRFNLYNYHINDRKIKNINPKYLGETDSE